MKTQIEHARLLKNLHIKGDPFILFNVWDAGSAQAMQEIGAKAIGTSSWAVAASHGYEDGEKLPLDLVLANIKRIISKVNLPVTVDIEGGYGQTSFDIEKTFIQVIEAGAAGINFEDQIFGTENLYSINDQCERIKTIRRVAEQTSIPIFINARTDVFFKSASDRLNSDLLEESINRAHAYAASGADGFFVPGLKNPDYIKRLCQVSPIPINIMLLSDMPSVKDLLAFGVGRISYGPTPYCQAMDYLKETGHKAIYMKNAY